MNEPLVPATGIVFLRFARDAYETRLELAPHPAGYQLISRSGSLTDGASRQLLSADRAPLAAEMTRLATALRAHGRTLIERRVVDESV